MSIESNNPNPFVEHRTAMLLTAAQIYRADQLGEPTHHIIPQVMPRAIGNVSTNELQDAQIAQNQVTVGARVLARHAQYADRIDEGGFKSVVAKLERIISLKTGDNRYLRQELDPQGLIAIIRNSR